MGDQLTVGGVIDGLDAYDFGRQRVLVLVNVSDELELRSRRADNEDLHRTVERPGDFVEESLGVFGMRLCFLGAPWMLVMHIAMRSLDRGVIDVAWLDIEDSRFLVINPNRNVCPHGASLELSWVAQRQCKMGAWACC